MDKLLIYYNPNHDRFYMRWYSYTDRDVGYVNSYDHILVQILEYNYDTGYLVNYSKKTYFKNRSSRRNRLINKLICLLYKFLK